MKRILGVALAMALGSVSCAEDHLSSVVGTDPSPSQAASTGSIAMQLTGVDEDGTTYWLRGAEFLIEPASPEADPARTVSSDTLPNSPTIVVSLATGMYTVTLQGDWWLEFETSQGTQQLRPTLDSSAVAHVSVSAKATTEVSFRFKIKRRGTLAIGIEVVFESVDDAATGGNGDAGSMDAGSGSLDAGTPPTELDASEPPDAQPPEEEDGGVVTIDAGPEEDAGIDASTT